MSKPDGSGAALKKNIVKFVAQLHKLQHPYHYFKT